jgi:hypothetical protein
MSDPYAWINKITSGKVKERIDKKIAKIQK